MTAADVLRWLLIAWVAGSLGFIPLMFIAGWLRHTVFPRVERRWWRLTAKRRRTLSQAHLTYQRAKTWKVRAAANRVIARNEVATFVAMEEELADWQRERRAREVYDWKDDEW